MAIKVRRGTDADRLTVTLAEGEIAYTTDTKKFYVGDGTTVGGNEVAGGGGGGGSGTVTSVAALTLGTSGTDLNSTVANSTTTPVITLNVPDASAANRGALSSIDWSTFNNKFTLPALTSGSVLFSNGTTIAQNNANFFWNNTNNRLGILTNSPLYNLDVNGTSRLNGFASVNGVNVANTALAVYAGGNNNFDSVIRGHDASGNQRFNFNSRGDLTLNGATDTGASGSATSFSIFSNFAPVGGSRDMLGISISQQINQTGGATGNSWGIYISPTITSAVNYTAIEATLGKIKFGVLAGSGNRMVIADSTGLLSTQAIPTGSGSGIVRVVNSISTPITAAAAATTDYVYFISGTTTLTLPTAVGNTNRYTLKNVGTNTVTINTTSSQTIDGSTSITMAVRYTALDLVSDGANWNII